MDNTNIPLQSLDRGWFHNRQGISVSMLRLDLTDAVISGNKPFKLKYSLQEAQRLGCKQVLTFGGAYSNHLVATAAMAQRQGLQSIGLIRGLQSAAQETHTLQQCRAFGMQLQPVDREAYSHKTDPAFLAQLQQQYPDAFIIPEGGASALGRQGAAEIAQLIPDSTTTVCLSVGTGTTLAGLREALLANVSIIGFAPIKGGAYLINEVAAFLSPNANANWTITDAYHFGGFGKMTEELTYFMQEFEQNCGFALDRVYTAKMMYGVRQMLQLGRFAQGENIVCIHTGGLQGNG